MFILFRRLIQTHRFLMRQSAYPVSLSTGLAISLFAARVYRSHSLIYAFLVWNLFLAWIPYLSSLWADYLHQRHSPRWWYLIIPGVPWLAFLPNAPYIVTDFWHLQERAGIPMWYDIGMLSTFALTGLFLAIFSLRTMQRLVKYHFGTILSWMFVTVVIGLSGLGVYLGRFLRWNSWDLVLQPQHILRDVANRLIHPLSNVQTFGVTFLFAAILMICYLTLASSESA